MPFDWFRSKVNEIPKDYLPLEVVIWRYEDIMYECYPPHSMGNGRILKKYCYDSKEDATEHLRYSNQNRTMMNKKNLALHTEKETMIYLLFNYLALLFILCKTFPTSYGGRIKRNKVMTLLSGWKWNVLKKAKFLYIFSIFFSLICVARMNSLFCLKKTWRILLLA